MVKITIGLKVESYFNFKTFNYNTKIIETDKHKSIKLDTLIQLTDHKI